MKTQNGIAYALPETSELLDVYQPDDSGKRAAVLMLHGGGWRVGSRSDLAPHAEALVRHGFTAVVADYRLMTDHPWPAQIRDVRAAIKWIRDNAGALGIEPDRIAALGYSAGAHLATLAAGDPDGAAAKDNLGRVPLNAVVPCEPIIGLQAGQYERGYAPSWSLFGPEPVRTQDIRDASPITFVRPDFPPSCFCHGVEDSQLPCIASINMQQALSRVGAVSDLHLFSTYPHALWRIESLIEPLLDVVVPFLDRTMVDPKPYVAELADFWATLPPGSGHPIPVEYREPRIPGQSG